MTPLAKAVARWAALPPMARKEAVRIIRAEFDWRRMLDPRWSTPAHAQVEAWHAGLRAAIALLKAAQAKPKRRGRRASG